MRRARTWLLALALAGAGGCGAPSSGEEADDGGLPFVAYNADFAGYQSWRSFTLVNPNPGGATHVAGTRTIYINHDPPPGATAFPRGTIIVKETASDGKIFARAKRGGAFNLEGATGWEWFELVQTASGPVIKWRGVGPPLGEVYGGDPNAGCNMCHKLAVANDYVLAPGLSLTPAPDAGAGDALTDAATNEVATNDDATTSVDATPDAALDGGTDASQD